MAQRRGGHSDHPSERNRVRSHSHNRRRGAAGPPLEVLWDGFQSAGQGVRVGKKKRKKIMKKSSTFVSYHVNPSLQRGKGGGGGFQANRKPS